MVDKIRALFSDKEGEAVYARILDTVERYSMTDLLNNGVLIGLSGGADSVFLSAFVSEYFRRTSSEASVLAVHINHMIRGDEADRDEAFSRSLAMALGFDFKALRLDVPAMAKESGECLEEAARNARYSAFAQIMQGREDLCAIATAHNMTDNAETVLFNIVRGSGSRGALGIAPVKGNLIRPLIDISKSDIRRLLDKHGIDFMLDSTNDSTEYSRNYIRHEILPKLERLNPRYEQSFANFCSALRDDLAFIEDMSRKQMSLASASRVARSLLLELHPAVFARFLSKFAAFNGAKRPDRVQILAIRELLDRDNFSYSLGGMDFVCERGSCYFREKSIASSGADLRVPIEYGVNRIPGYSALISIADTKVSSSNVYKISIQADMSSAIIDGSLYVRFRRDGDAYYYGGMTHKLKKVFNDRGIPPSRRCRIPVICDEKGIVWVPGMGVRDDGGNREKKMFISFSVPYGDDGEELYAALKET